MTRNEAIDALKANYPDACYGELREAVDLAIKVLEESERKKGKWIDRGDYCICNQCWHTEQQFNGVEPIPLHTPYCAMCGADMREEKPKKGTWICGYDVRCSNCCYKLQTTGLPSRCPNYGTDMIGTTLDDR